MTNKTILDVACGSRMFWFDKQHPNALFVDNRTVPRQVIWQKGDNKREFEVSPDIVMDFRELALPDNLFHLVVFDPPHLHKRNGKTGWMNTKYGSLSETWHDDLKRGFAECFRVLKPNGTLIFKWCETEIPLHEILSLTPEKPLFGNRSGKSSKTHWVCFMKLQNGGRDGTI